MNNYELKEDEILEIRSDRVFHDMFNEHEMDTIEWTVMQILNCSYEDIHGKVTVGNSRLTNPSLDDKTKYVDLIVEFKDEIIIIELNNNATTNYLRNVLYAMNSIINKYLVGEGYLDKRVTGILVNLNWYKNINESNNIPGKEIINYQYPSNEYKDEYLLKIININLDYYQKLCYDETEKSDTLWKLFTINNKTDLGIITKEEKLLNNYHNKLKRLSHDKEYCRMVWDERLNNNLVKHDYYISGFDKGIEQGLEQGTKNGLKQGIEQTRQEMIINMYNDKVPIETISKYSNLSIDEIKKIIDN